MKVKRVNDWRNTFNFNISREKAIYKYLCGEKIGLIERKLILNYKFDSYFVKKIILLKNTQCIVSIV